MIISTIRGNRAAVCQRSVRPGQQQARPGRTPGAACLSARLNSKISGIAKVMIMTGELHTPAEAAKVLKVRESWLRAKATARTIPCTFIGKHLRFSDDDIAAIMRDDLTAALQARWLDSLRQRAKIDPHSPVPLLDELLSPLRRPADHPRWETRREIRPEMISQIPPNKEEDPIRQVG